MNEATPHSLSPVELIRRIENLVRLGTVEHVNHDHPARCRVRSGGLLTNWVPWINTRAGVDVTWWPPTVGEQCLLFCPGGDPINAVALVGVYSDAHPQNSPSPTEHRTTYRNGDYIVHDSADGSLVIHCQGPIRITGSRIDLNP